MSNRKQHTFTAADAEKQRGWQRVEPEGCPYSPVYYCYHAEAFMTGRNRMGMWDDSIIYRVGEVYYTMDEPYSSRKARQIREKLGRNDISRTVDISRYDFATREGRARFIDETESSIYDGFNVDGEYVLVFLQQGQGMAVWTRHHMKPRWFEVIYFDESGYQEGVTYKPAAVKE